MFVTNWISPTKIQKISEITNFFRHYFLSRTEVYFINGLNSVLFLCLIFEFIKSITIYANHCALADEGVWINL